MLHAGIAPAGTPELEADIGSHIQPGQQARFLEHQTDVAGMQSRRLAAQRDPSLVVGVQTSQDATFAFEEGTATY
jgi:hypothetical protein